MKGTTRIVVPSVAGLILALALPASAQTSDAPPSDAWAWRFGVNLWLPTIHSSTQLDLPNGGDISSEADPGGYLSKLKGVFMGTLEARRGPWSFLADALYLDLGGIKSKVRSISGPGGEVTVPIDAGTRTDLKGFIGTIEGGYAVLQTPGARADVVAGLRYASLKPKLEWELSGPTGGLANAAPGPPSKANTTRPIRRRKRQRRSRQQLRPARRQARACAGRRAARSSEESWETPAQAPPRARSLREARAAARTRHRRSSNSKRPLSKTRRAWRRIRKRVPRVLKGVVTP